MTALAQPPAPAVADHRRRRWLIAAAAVAVAALVGWLVGFSSVLGVRTVTVSGTHLLSVAQVRSAADLRTGEPLLRVDAGAVEARIRALPEVRTARVSISYPSSVSIAIAERVAVGYRSDGPMVSEVDADNVEFRRVAVAPKGLPRLEAVGDPARSAAVAAVAGALPRAVVATVATIAAPSAESVTLTLTDGRIVLWGGTDREADKARLLPALLSQPGGYFDLSDPSAVISRSSASGH